MEKDGVSGMPRTDFRRFTIKTEHHTNLGSAGCSNPVAIGQLWMITGTRSFTESDWKSTGSDWLSLFEICILG